MFWPSDVAAAASAGTTWAGSRVDALGSAIYDGYTWYGDRIEETGAAAYDALTWYGDRIEQQQTAVNRTGDKLADAALIGATGYAIAAPAVATLAVAATATAGLTLVGTKTGRAALRAAWQGVLKLVGGA